MKRVLFCLTALLLSTLLSSCVIGEEQVNGVKVTSVTINLTALNLSVGLSESLTVSVLPEDASNKEVIWSSSNPNVATVSSSGRITAVAAGTTTITVTTKDGSKTASCTVTVSVSVTGVSLNKTSTSLNVVGTEQLTATIQPSNATNKNVTWSSSNSSVAMVNSSGLVTAVASGSAIITVKTVDGSKTATCSVTVAAGSGTTELIKNATFWGTGAFQGSFEFIYDDKQRLTSVVAPWVSEDGIPKKKEVFVLFYPSNDIVIEWDNERYTYTLDNNGYVIRCNYDYGYLEPHESVFFSYSPDGYLAKAGNVASWTWENGNIIKIVSEYDDGNIVTQTRRYSTVENKTNINLFSSFMYDRYDETGFLRTYTRISNPCLPSVWLIGMFKGWVSKNFLQSETMTDLKGAKTTNTDTYNFDSSGNPTKIIVSSDHPSSSSLDFFNVTFTYY